MKPLSLRASLLRTGLLRASLLRASLSQICYCLFALTLFQLAATHPGASYGAHDLDDVSIGGRITDETGARVVGAKVTVVLVATNAERSTVADGEGRYRLVELAPGAYTVRASSVGFAVEERARVETLAGQTVRLDFTLRPAGVAAEQVVTSDAPKEVVDTTRTVVGGTLTRAELETLPIVTRSPLDLIFTLGGVTEEPLSVRDVAEDRNRTAARTPEEAGTFALSGGAAYSNNITIDGLDNNDDRAARERFQPSLEAIEEVQVVTNQFSAEYGRASGGRVNLRTRGGAKVFHGRAFYFFRDESLDANSAANNARGLKRLPLQEHNPGYTLGGALKFPARQKSGATSRPPRHFFFVADELQTILDSTVIDTYEFGHKP